MQGWVIDDSTNFSSPFFRGLLEKIVLGAVWTDHKAIIDVPKVLLDFRYVATFLNDVESKAIVVESRVHVFAYFDQCGEISQWVSFFRARPGILIYCRRGSTRQSGRLESGWQKRKDSRSYYWRCEIGQTQREQVGLWYYQVGIIVHWHGEKSILYRYQLLYVSGVIHTNNMFALENSSQHDARVAAAISASWLR